MKYFTITLCGMLILISQSLFAQSYQPGDEASMMHMYEKHMLEMKQNASDGEQGLQKVNFDLSGLFLVLDPDQEWSFSDNPNPEYNFNIYGQGMPAGDINGDGKNDIIFSTGIAGDERTSDLSDRTGKTAIFYGGNATTEPDELHYRFMIPVGDLNGNGYADVLAHIDFGMYEIYYGSAEGLTASSHPVNFSGASPLIIGFIDLDGDGYGDILAYNRFGNSMQIFWGGADLEQAESAEWVVNHSLNQVNIHAGDINGDGTDEVIAFGPNGELYYQRFDDDRWPEQVQTGNIEFDGHILNNHFHILDINGNGHGEIFYYEFAQSNRYVLTYDSIDDQINTGRIILHDNQAYPAGDLNDDGRMDFIISNPEDNHSPHIAFGPADLNDGLSKDVSLLGDTDEDWTWAMSFNSYPGYGDLTGNGIDDLVISHAQLTEDTRGRRYVYGAADGNFASEFVHFPRKHFLNYIARATNVGDVNGNGFDDLALANFYDQTIDVYFGGSGMQSPSISINVDFEPLDISSGDFNGNGYSDILIGYNAGNSIDIVFGGETISSSPDFSINPEDFVTGFFSSSYIPTNIGDVNGNGYDDFASSSLLVYNIENEQRVYNNEIYIFFGGENISSTPDVTLNPTEETNLNYTGIAFNSLGDINDNGFDDFAFSILFADGSKGRVMVYHGNDSGTFEDPEIIRPDYDDGNVFEFGSDIAAADITGNGFNDLIIKPGVFYDGNALVIYEGGKESFSDHPDYFLKIPAQTGIGPDFTGDGYVNSAFPFASSIQSVPDFSNTGHENIIVSSQTNATNAVGFFGQAIVQGYNYPDLLFNAPNKNSSLGGAWGFAVGEFSDGIISAVMPQSLDNNDAFRSSRMYAFHLPVPLELTSIEDVPDDQGYWVTIRAGGYLMEAQLESIQAFSTWSVWMMGDDGWESKATVNYLDEAATRVDVRVPTTLPTDADAGPESPHTYLFKVTAHSYYGDLIAESNEMWGYALDNIAPAKVTGVNAAMADGKINLEWDASSANDLGEYQIWEVDESGQPGDEPVLSTGNTTASIDYDENADVIRLAVSAVDVHNNKGVISETAEIVITSTSLLSDLPAEFELNQNYPNPFNPTTVLPYALPEDSHVRITIYDMIGREVTTLVNTDMTAGYHTANFDAKNLASGMYIYRIRAGEYVQSRTMSVIK